MLWGHISYMMGNEQSRRTFINACEQLLQDVEENKTNGEYIVIIGARFQSIVTKSEMEGASRDLALKTAGLFLNINEPYLAKGRFQRIAKMVGDFAERTVRDWTTRA